MTATEPPGLTDETAFERFFNTVEAPLRRALTAAYGSDAGREAAAEALAWAWEHRDRLDGLDRPVAYLYRVAQSRSRRRRPGTPFARHEWREPWVEPELAGALRRLSERQRVAVVLIHGYSWTHAEVADLLGIGISTVQTHLERGLDRLRQDLEVD